MADLCGALFTAANGQRMPCERVKGHPGPYHTGAGDRMPAPPASFLMEVGDGVLEAMGTRTDGGRRITVEIGDPVGYAHMSDGRRLDVYSPTFTQHDDGG